MGNYTIYVVEKWTVLSHTVIIYMEIFGLKYVRLNLRYLCLNHPINNINVKIDDAIHGNNISTNDMSVMENLKNLSVLITQHLITQIIVSNRNMIPK